MDSLTNFAPSIAAAAPILLGIITVAITAIVVRKLILRGKTHR